MTVVMNTVIYILATHAKNVDEWIVATVAPLLRNDIPNVNTPATIISQLASQKLLGFFMRNIPLIWLQPGTWKLLSMVLSIFIISWKSIEFIMEKGRPSQWMKSAIFI